MRSPPRLLVVDDNAANVDILRTRLLAHGYEIFTAADGEEALAATANANIVMFLVSSAAFGFGMAGTVKIGQPFDRPGEGAGD